MTTTAFRAERAGGARSWRQALHEVAGRHVDARDPLIPVPLRRLL